MARDYPISKYKKILKKAEATEANEVRVRVGSRPFSYAAYAGKQLLEEKQDFVYLNATGAAVSNAIKVIEYLKRHIKGLHVQYKILSKKFVDEYEPMVEGLDKVTTERIVSTLECVLTLTKGDQLKTTAGYMEPLPDTQVDQEKFEDALKGYQERKDRRAEDGDRDRSGDRRSGSRRRRGGRRGGRGGRGGRRRDDRDERDDREERGGRGGRVRRGDDREYRDDRGPRRQDDRGPRRRDDRDDREERGPRRQDDRGPRRGGDRDAPRRDDRDFREERGPRREYTREDRDERDFREERGPRRGGDRGPRRGDRDGPRYGDRDAPRDGPRGGDRDGPRRGGRGGSDFRY